MGLAEDYDEERQEEEEKPEKEESKVTLPECVKWIIIVFSAISALIGLVLLGFNMYWYFCEKCRIALVKRAALFIFPRFFLFFLPMKLLANNFITMFLLKVGMISGAATAGLGTISAVATYYLYDTILIVTTLISGILSLGSAIGVVWYFADDSLSGALFKEVGKILRTTDGIEFACDAYNMDWDPTGALKEVFNYIKKQIGIPQKCLGLIVEAFNFFKPIIGMMFVFVTGLIFTHFIVTVLFSYPIWRKCLKKCGCIKKRAAVQPRVLSKIPEPPNIAGCVKWLIIIISSLVAIIGLTLLGFNVYWYFSQKGREKLVETAASYIFPRLLMEIISTRLLANNFITMFVIKVGMVFGAVAGGLGILTAVAMHFLYDTILIVATIITGILALGSVVSVLWYFADERLSTALFKKIAAAMSNGPKIKDMCDVYDLKFMDKATSWMPWGIGEAISGAVKGLVNGIKDLVGLPDSCVSVIYDAFKYFKPVIGMFFLWLTGILVTKFLVTVLFTYPIWKSCIEKCRKKKGDEEQGKEPEKEYSNRAYIQVYNTNESMKHKLSES